MARFKITVSKKEIEEVVFNTVFVEGDTQIEELVEQEQEIRPPATCPECGYTVMLEKS